MRAPYSYRLRSAVAARGAVLPRAKSHVAGTRGPPNMPSRYRGPRRPGPNGGEARAHSGWRLALLLSALILLALLGLAILTGAVGSRTRAPASPREPEALERSSSTVAGGDVDSPAVGGTCIDDDVMCDAWHKAGLCRRHGQRCRRACGLCPGVPARVMPREHAARCTRDNHTPAVRAGRLGPLFERVLSDFPQYAPRALSTDPWVVVLKDFISVEEGDALLGVCKEHFARSLAGDQVNPVRTSTQCWCNFGACFTHPLVHAVHRRIHNLTGIPYNNGEDMQVSPAPSARAPRAARGSPARRARADRALRAGTVRQGAPRPDLRAVGTARAARPDVFHVPTRAGLRGRDRVSLSEDQSAAGARLGDPMAFSAR